jgi:uncharacterized protein with HEPN domain
MSKRDDRVSVRQMLDHAREALDLVQGATRAEIEVNRLLGLGLTRLLEIMGEAASRVSADFRSTHPSIPWAKVVGLRNRLIHAYDVIDYDVLWKILQEDLPALILALQGILEESP